MLSYAETVLCHTNESTYHLLRGRIGVDAGARNSKVGRQMRVTQDYDVQAINHAFPSLSTLKQHLQRPSCDEDTTHWSWIFTMCEMSRKSKIDLPRLSGDGLTRYLISVQYDGQPIRQGAHVRPDKFVSLIELKHHIVYVTWLDLQEIRGVRPHITHEDLIESKANESGPRALLQRIDSQEKHRFVAEVVEVFAVTADSSIRMNTHTLFSVLGDSHVEVEKRLDRIVSDLNVCSACINGVWRRYQRAKGQVAQAPVRTACLMVLIVTQYWSLTFSRTWHQSR